MIEIDLSEFNRWAQSCDAAPERLHRENLTATRVILHEMATVAKENAPVKDGPLRADIRVMKIAKREGDSYTGRVGTDLIYSAQREYGGTIRARNKPYLVFKLPAAVTEKNPEGWVAVKEVTQTGSKYMEAAEADMSGRVADYYELAIDRALEGVL